MLNHLYNTRPDKLRKDFMKLNEKTVELSYSPMSWGVTIKKGEIVASVLWKASYANDWGQFGNDEGEYKVFCDNWVESKRFTEIGIAHKWLEKKVGWGYGRF